MLDMNQTTVTTFLLLGFQNNQIFNIFLYILILLTYLLTIVGNVLIIILVTKIQTLKSPMYYFLCHLSLSDILSTTNITPNMLWVILNRGGTIQLTGCFTQFYFYCALAAVECLLLTVMSYDRYLAICNPLHYISIMDFRLCLHLAVWSWTLSFMSAFFVVLLVNNLQFCGPFIINHYFCDFAPLLKLSCSDTSVVEITDFILGIPFVLFSFIFIFFTYIFIFITILGISSDTGRQKAFSTCSSHLAVVSMFYGTLTAVYMVPSKGHSFNIKKLISLLYTVGTPFFNPIIYSLRNQEIKVALLKFISTKLGL